MPTLFYPGSSNCISPCIFCTVIISIIMWIKLPNFLQFYCQSSCHTVAVLQQKMYQGCWNIPHSLAFGWRHAINACWDQVFTSDHGEENTQMKSWRNKNGWKVGRTNISLVNKELQGHRPELGSLNQISFQVKRKHIFFYKKALQHIARQRKSASSKGRVASFSYYFVSQEGRQILSFLF